MGRVAIYDRSFLRRISDFLPMHSSSVLLVQPHRYHSTPPGLCPLSSPVDMSGAKLNLANMRHYSLDSPSLTSPPAYDILLPGPGGGGGGGGVDHTKLHPCATGFTAGPLGAICSQNNVMGTPLPMASSPAQFANPHLVMAPTTPLHIGKFHCTKHAPLRTGPTRAVVLKNNFL